MQCTPCKWMSSTLKNILQVRVCLWQVKFFTIVIPRWSWSEFIGLITVFSRVYRTWLGKSMVYTDVTLYASDVTNVFYKHTHTQKITNPGKLHELKLRFVNSIRYAQCSLLDSTMCAEFELINNISVTYCTRTIYFNFKQLLVSLTHVMFLMTSCWKVVVSDGPLT